MVRREGGGRKIRGLVSTLADNTFKASLGCMGSYLNKLQITHNRPCKYLFASTMDRDSETGNRNKWLHCSSDGRFGTQEFKMISE